MATLLAQAAKSVVAESKKNSAALDEEAIQEGQVAVEEAIDDHLADSLVPPFGLLAQGLKKVATKLVPDCLSNRIADIVTMPGSAFLHLMTIELLTVYVFAYSVGSVLMLIVETNLRRLVEEDPTVKFLDEKAETCLKEMARGKVYKMRCHDRAVCFEKGFDVDDTYACDKMENQVWFYIFCGAVFFCSLLVLDVLGRACYKGVARMRISSGAYLAFCFKQKRTYLYRYIAGFFLVCAVFTICGLLAYAFYEGVFVWAVEMFLGPTYVVAHSLLHFSRPYKAKFDYTGDDFKDIAFVRTFFETSSGFGKRLSTALVQSQRFKKAPLLKEMLRASTDADVNKFRSICKFDAPSEVRAAVSVM